MHNALKYQLLNPGKYEKNYRNPFLYDTKKKYVKCICYIFALIDKIISNGQVNKQ